MFSRQSKTTGLACALTLVLCLAPVAGTAQEGMKYAFVNISKVISESDQGQAEARELEAIGSQKEEELNARRQELAELVEQYEESVSAGQPDEELRDRVEKLKRDLERDLRQAQSDVDTSRQDRIQAIGNRVVQLVRQFGEDNGYAAIFRVDGGQVVYADPAANITDQIISAYNKAHPAE